jgi:hypothetical protein
MQKKHSGKTNNSINNRLLSKSSKSNKKSKLSIFQNKKEAKNDLFEDFLNKLEIKTNQKRVDFLKEFCIKNGGLDCILKEFDNNNGSLFKNKQTDSLNNLMLDMSDVTKNNNNSSNNNNNNNIPDLIQLTDLNLNTDFDSISVYNFTDDNSTDNESLKHFSSKLKSTDLGFIEKLKIDLLALSKFNKIYFLILF